MATVEKNLSHYDKNTIPNASKMRFGIVVSEWNEKITNGLLEGALAALKENGAKEENIIVKYMPGSFELALGAQYLLEHLQIDGVIAVVPTIPTCCRLNLPLRFHFAASLLKESHFC